MSSTGLTVDLKATKTLRNDVHRGLVTSAPENYAAQLTEPCFPGKSQDIDASDNTTPPSLHTTSSRAKDRLTPNICAVQLTDNPNNFVFRCTFPRCRARTFTRWYDFHRHYNGAHALEKTFFWCPVPGCGRSEGEGNHGFPRKDKMLDHVSKVHSHAAQSRLE